MLIFHCINKNLLIYNYGRKIFQKPAAFSQITNKLSTTDRRIILRNVNKTGARIYNIMIYNLTKSKVNLNNSY